MQLKYINKENKYKTIRQVLKQEFHIASRLISKLKQEKCILLNGKSMYIDKELLPNDEIVVKIDFEEPDDNKIISVNMQLNILYEDESLLIINKPPFMPVHPSSSHLLDTLSNGIKYYYNKNNIKHKIRLVNRLDKDTSGIVVFAKNAYVQECLIDQMRKGSFHKEYIGIVYGKLENANGIINKPIKRKKGSIIEREVALDGDASVTYYERIKVFKNYTLVKFILKTGRTHQIRVHSKYIGHPILGDTLYSHSSFLINRQALHAHKVSFIHPITKKTLCIEANIPNDMQKLCT